MSGRGKPIPGFDYCAEPGEQEVQYVRAVWRELAANTVRNGGRVRVADGETFIHGADGKIRQEIYGYIGSIDHAQEEGSGAAEGAERTA